MKKRTIGFLAGSMIAGFLLAGCGQGQPEAKMTPEQVKAEAAKMDAKQLQAKIDSYKPAIDAKKAELEKVIAKLKAVPLDKMLSDDTKKIKAESEDINGAISKLSSDMQIYVDELKAKSK